METSPTGSAVSADAAVEPVGGGDQPDRVNPQGTSKERRYMSPQTEAAIRRAAAMGDHNSRVLLRLAETVGLPQGTLPRLFVRPQASK